MLFTKAFKALLAIALLSFFLGLNFRLIMRLPIFQVDAFTDKVFGGNPAAICPLKNWLSDDVMQRIAMENSIAI